MTRRAELESQVAVLREAKQRLEEHVAAQDQALAQAELRDGTLRSLQATYDELADVAGPAMLAVARRLEANAATMAIAEGSDIAEYHRLVARAHELRAAVGEAAERYEDAATVLHDELTDPSPTDAVGKRGLTTVNQPDERAGARPGWTEQK